jgi:hypothetical protein
MKRIGFPLGVVVFLAGIALFAGAEGHAYWLLWNSANPDLGRIHAGGSDLVPFALQLAIYEGGAGHWSSAEVRLPVLALGAMVLGPCLGSLVSLDWHELPRLRRWLRGKGALKNLGHQAPPTHCPRCGSPLGKGVSRCWASECTYEVGDWYPGRH